MKTFWKTPRDGNWAMAKRKELREKTGLKWTTSLIGGGWKFDPVISLETVPDPEAGARLLTAIRGMSRRDRKWGVSFEVLSRETGIPLAEVVSGAKALIQSGDCRGQPNRAGGIYAISLWKQNPKNWEVADAERISRKGR